MQKRPTVQRRNFGVRGQGRSAIPRLALPPRPDTSHRGPRILVVEDHDDTRKMYAAYLRYVGLGVVTARHGRSALNKARALNPGVIVLDLMMPEMDGWEVLRELKSNEETSRIPVIVVTGHDWKDHLKHAALAAGAAAYLKKPCLPDHLASEVRRVLDRHDPAA